MPQSSKVLLIGSSYSSAPILKSLKNRNLHVTVCGAVKDDPCHAYADGSLLVDYSDHQKLLEETSKHDFDYIVPSCNDTAYMAGISLAETLGFTGFDDADTANILHTKHRFREFTTARGLPVPRWGITSNPAAIDHIPYPKLVKPVDAFSGRGVSKVYEDYQLNPAIQAAIAASHSGQAVIEEFVEGTLHSHSAFISDGRIISDFFVDEFCTVYPYQVDCSNHPSNLSDTIKKDFHETMQSLVNDLRLCDGLLHTQFIANGQDFWIIECMRRAPGDLYPHLISKSTGFPYFDFYTRPFIGEKLIAVSEPKRTRPIARHTISRSKDSSMFSLDIKLPKEPKSLEVVPLQRSGHPLGSAPFDKAAIIFAEFPDFDSLVCATPQLASHLKTRTLEDLDGSHE